MTSAADPPRRIALIASSFAPHVGGVEEHVAQVARGLAGRGHAVEVWTVDRGVRPERPSGHGVAVRYLPTPLPARSVPDLVRFAGRAPGAWSAWRLAYRRFRPDVLHVHCFGPNGLYALAMHRRFRTPIMITSHGETTGDDTSVFTRSALLRRGLRLALADAAIVTAPTEYVLNDLRAAYGLRGGQTVPNGVDLGVEETDPGFAPPYLLAYGRLGRMKGFDLLLDAYARTEQTDLPLVIGGDGPEQDALAAQTRALGVHDRVRMPGRLTAGQVAGAVARATAVIVPSRSEAFGIVALETWRGAAPLVMTARGGAAEFLRDGEDALLVDPEDAAALAAAIDRISSDTALRHRLAAAGAERVVEFTWDAVVDRYEALYARIGESAV